MRRMTPCWIVLALVAPGIPAALRAEESPSTISITGVGVVQRMPDSLEIKAEVKGEAELAEDALVKFRDAKRRARETLEKLGIEGLAIRDGGFEIRNSVADQNAMMGMVVMGGGAANQNLEPRFVVTEKLKLTLTGIDRLETPALLEKLVKILDTAKDAGLQLGGPPPNPYQVRGAAALTLARFKLTDVDGLRQDAYRKAMEDARKSAERIAALAESRVGPVVSVRLLPAKEKRQNQPTLSVWGVVSHEDDQETLTSSNLAPIPIKVELAVVFELKK